MLRVIKDDKVKDPIQDMLRRISLNERKVTIIFDMLRRMKYDEVQ